jgi:hypothetical protein
MAAISGGGCVTSGSSFGFVVFSGTSASAPGMAGVAALLDQKLGSAQGNLNPQLYPLAASAPSAYHDTTVSSSGVSGCGSNTVSLCNNSVSLLSGSGAQAGFTVGTGYDEATGLGSLDVAAFLNNFAASSVTKITPAVNVTPAQTSISASQSLSVTVAVSGGSGNPTATGSVTLTSGTYTSAATTLVAGSASVIIPAGSLAAGNDTLTATYSSDSNYNASAGSKTVTVTPGTGFTISGAAVTLTAGATTGDNSTITISPTNGFTGSVTLTATVASSPSGALHIPTFTFTTNPVSITSTAAVTATLTIATAATQTTACVAVNESPSGIPWYAKGGAVLACMLLFGIAPTRRKGRAMLGALLLLFALAGGMMACGGSKLSSCTQTTTPGTTAGTYTITVTGTSGATTATSAPIALTVN